MKVVFNINMRRRWGLPREAFQALAPDDQRSLIDFVLAL
jgi:hypothetical protein